MLLLLISRTPISFIKSSQTEILTEVQTSHSCFQSYLKKNKLIKLKVKKKTNFKLLKRKQ